MYCTYTCIVHIHRHTHVHKKIAHVYLTHIYLHVDVQEEAIVTWTFTLTPSLSSYRLPASVLHPPAALPAPPDTTHTPPPPAAPTRPALWPTHSSWPCQQQPASCLAAAATSSACCLLLAKPLTQRFLAGRVCQWRRQGRASAADRGSARRGLPAAGVGRREWATHKKLRLGNSFACQSVCPRPTTTEPQV